MAKRSRVRRVMKWAGLVGCVLTTGLLVTSLFAHVAYTRNWNTIELHGGAVLWMPRGVAPDMPLRVIGPSLGLATWMPKKLRAPRNLVYGFVIPLWIPLILLAIPTYILWRRDRRKPERCCRQCGYDLTGNESGVCPECGTKIEQP